MCLVFPAAGGGKYAAGQNGSGVRLGPGDVLLLSQGAGGRLRVLEGEELVFWHFSLSVEHLYPLFAGHEIALLQGVLEGLKGAKVYPASSTVATQCHQLVKSIPPELNVEHRSHLVRVASVILADEFKGAHRQRAGFVRPEEHLHQVFEKLSADELMTDSVGELAEKFGCSRRHLNRLFHQQFGSSVAGLRMEMRLTKALALLRDPDAKVINVAGRCGFNHLGLFNTCFKKRFGASPGQWRKQAGQAAGNGSAGQPAEPLVCPLHANGLCPWAGRPMNAAGPGPAQPAAANGEHAGA
jgi:AraC-like DNA-binding protein